jgi:hypothetical protein
MSASGPATVYVLCFAASLLCTALLARSYWRSRSGLLLWTAFCFGLLALNNALLVVDRLVMPEAIDLRLWRQLTALAAIGVLLYGFIWESD